MSYPQKPVNGDGMTLEEWVKCTEGLLVETYKIDFVDVGYRDEDIVKYWKAGFEPKEFVDWFGEKYDLFEAAQTYTPQRRGIGS